MSGSRRYKAPQAHGEVLADPSPDDAARLVGPSREIRRKLLPDDLFTSARRNVLDAAVSYLRENGEPVPTLNDGPLIVTGHQPELFHPGVWAKNFAANGLARRVNGVSLNLIADSDTLKVVTVGVPDTKRDEAVAGTVSFRGTGPETPYESAKVTDTKHFFDARETLQQVASGWPFRPILGDWRHALAATPSALVGEVFSRLRREQEREWGCHNLELPVSRLCRTDAWAEFVAAIERRLPEFTQVYNAAIVEYRRANCVRSENHPAPLLEPGERPFWRMTATGRDRPFEARPPGELRPRALTLTLFARLFFADLWIHGIGGGKYDEVTDAIVRGFFGGEPPAYQVLTLTAHLPFAVEGDPAAEYRKTQATARDRVWNPQRHLPHRITAYADGVAQQVRDAIAEVPASHRERLARHHRLRDLKAQLLAAQFPKPDATVAAAALARQQTAAILRRRDYAWVLFPEATLRPLMTQFL